MPWHIVVIYMFWILTRNTIPLGWKLCLSILNCIPQFTTKVIALLFGCFNRFFLSQMASFFFTIFFMDETMTDTVKFELMAADSELCVEEMYFCIYKTHTQLELSNELFFHEWMYTSLKTLLVYLTGDVCRSFFLTRTNFILKWNTNGLGPSDENKGKLETVFLPFLPDFWLLNRNARTDGGWQPFYILGSECPKNQTCSRSGVKRLLYQILEAWQGSVYGERNLPCQGGLSGGSVDPHDDDVHNGYVRLTLLSTTRLQHVQSDQNAPTRNQQFEVPCSKPRVHYSLKVVPVTRY